MIKAAAFLLIGVITGVLLVAEFRSIPVAQLFGQNIRDIGAKQPPVKVPDNVRALNDAFVAAATAVSPTVVSIEVIGEDKGSDVEEFFRFFSPWDDEEFFSPPRNRDQQRDSRPRSRPLGQGSGVIITSDGYIVTNNHVIRGAKPDGVKVTLSDKREFTAKIIGRDSLTDLAVIKIDAKDLPTAYLGTNADIRVGEWVIAVGNPLQLRSTVTAGIISAIGRGGMGLNRGQFAIENYIQTDAAINPGNSGGGLFTLNGTLIGINTAIASGTGFYAGYGFAIPVDIVRKVALDLINTGKVIRPYIGVTIHAVDETDAKGAGLSKVQGVMVDDVLKNSPAERAGILSQDIILDVDGVPVNSPNELQTLILQRRPGDKVKLRIWRDRKEITKEVQLEAKDGVVASADKTSEPVPGERATDNEPVTFDDLGFSVAPLSAEAKNRLEVNTGVEVTRVERYSEAYMRGLSPRSVILRADRQSIESTGQLRSIIARKKPGEVVVLEVKFEGGKRIVSLNIPSKAN
ncbi:MAG: trypsin-like peptidase domain-containing protein [Bacteroidota bacterium]|nr:trypsin-like peptidase domain-containing protein [Candidatus Kapabacteria bacterium]MCS7301878.1 trypsin-like peptidase domain-containing protein [Candidatus Kapabacteria bacterium]MCX7936131.1 trypsin-like peptidase domain-containing protein [Chlorobiota bacterium]MDW8074975.1 trypsin-like peptidase domain-containing protein [Bacteroidota bacterium]MDW8271614.1 trypsin-like peptidase domain-containing protein [Bacteroidota bacterium]